MKSNGTLKRTMLILIILLTLSLIGGLLYKVYQSRNNKPTPVTTESNTQTTTTPPTTAPLVADYTGVPVTSGDKEFSLMVPNGWKTVTNCTNSDTLFVTDKDTAVLDYLEATAPVVEQLSCGDDSLKLFSVVTNSAAQAQPDDPDAVSFVTSSGLQGTRICRDNVASTGISSKILFQQCTYQFKQDNSVYTITYTRPDSSYLDRTGLMDRVVKSFTLQ